jgi:hypothetical protein
MGKPSRVLFGITFRALRPFDAGWLTGAPPLCFKSSRRIREMLGNIRHGQVLRPLQIALPKVRTLPPSSWSLDLPQRGRLPRITS